MLTSLPTDCALPGDEVRGGFTWVSDLGLVATWSARRGGRKAPALWVGLLAALFASPGTPSASIRFRPDSLLAGLAGAFT